MSSPSMQENLDVLTASLSALLAQYPLVKLGLLFGSLLLGRATPSSDLDLGVAAAQPLDLTTKMALIEAVALIAGRPVDLVDLHVVHGPLLRHILCQGRLIHCTDQLLYAALIRKMLLNQSDMMPYYERILAARRQAWIGR